MSSTRRGLSLQGHRDATYLNLIGGIWEFRRRVPKDLAGVDPRKQIRVSTGTRDWARAVSIAAHARLNEELEEHWRLLAQAVHRRRHVTRSTPTQSSRPNDSKAAASFHVPESRKWVVGPAGFEPATRRL